MKNPFWAVMPKKHMSDLLTDDQRLRVREEFVEPNCDGPQGWVFHAGLCQCCMSHVVRGTYMDYDPTAALDPWGSDQVSASRGLADPGRKDGGL